MVKFFCFTLNLSDSAHLYWNVTADCTKSKQLTADRSINSQQGKGVSEIKKEFVFVLMASDRVCMQHP